MNLIDLLFPKKCLECNKEGKYLCDQCVHKVPLGRRIENHFSIFKYKGVIRKAIIALKYKFATDITGELSVIIYKELNRNSEFFYKSMTLVPIPLHRRRENLRGFNQAELIGRKLAQKMNWKFIPELLIRNKNTVPQVSLKGLPRHVNVTGVFSVNSKASVTRDLHLLLFDDVYTTASTIMEAKKTLKTAGFINIYSLTIAR